VKPFVNDWKISEFGGDADPQGKSLRMDLILCLMRKRCRVGALVIALLN